MDPFSKNRSNFTKLPLFFKVGTFTLQGTNMVTAHFGLKSPYIVFCILGCPCSQDASDHQDDLTFLVGNLNPNLHLPLLL